MKNLFEALPSHLPEELIETLGGNENVKIERIVSHGHASEEGFWYEQQEHEFVLLIQGGAELEFEDKTIRLKPGDYLTIEAGEKHRVKWTVPDMKSVWLAVFYPPE
ncbi:MAG: cupin domain-containing protein [Mariprofundaceae bacterium]